VDGEVATREVVLQRHVGRGVEAETVVARPRLALGARQRVFLAGVGMQEHREILADRLVALRQHVFGRRADHHVVAIEMRAAQQLVAYRAADQVHAVRGRGHAQVSWVRRAKFRRRSSPYLPSTAGSIAAKRRGVMPSSAKPSRLPTESTRSELKLSREKGLPGISSAAIACKCPSTLGSGSTARRRSATSRIIRTIAISSSVSRPYSSWILPMLARSPRRRRIACAMSPTYAGWNFACGCASGNTGAMRNNFKNRNTKLSPSPYTTLGR